MREAGITICKSFFIGWRGVRTFAIPLSIIERDHSQPYYSILTPSD